MDKSDEEEQYVLYDVIDQESEEENNQKTSTADQSSESVKDNGERLTGETTFCQICKTIFRTPEDLREHLPLHKTEKILYCPICSRIFQRHDRLMKHIAKHAKTPLSCWFCIRTFAEEREEAFASHLQSHSEYLLEKSQEGREKYPGQVPEYMCCECNRQFWFRNSLERHLGLHRAHQCPICRTNLKDRASLTKHIGNHVEKRPNQCQVCHKIFRSVYFMQRHQVLHVRCFYCNDQMVNSSSIKEHIRKCHNGLPYVPTDGPVKCTICGDTFPAVEVLKDHLSLIEEFKLPHKKINRRVDRKIKKSVYKCAFCGKKFKTRDYIIQHLRIHKNNRPMYPCNICGQKFKTPYSIPRHIKTIHMGQKPEKSTKQCLNTNFQIILPKQPLNLHVKEEIKHEELHPDENAKGAEYPQKSQS